MRRDPGGFGGRHVIWKDVEGLTERALDTFRFRHPTLALLPENLPLKPRHLAAQADDFALLRVEQNGHLRHSRSHCWTGDFRGGYWSEGIAML